jgi:hypothetical protein
MTTIGVYNQKGGENIASSFKSYIKNNYIKNNKEFSSASTYEDKKEIMLDWIYNDLEFKLFLNGYMDVQIFYLSIFSEDQVKKLHKEDNCFLTIEKHKKYKEILAKIKNLEENIFKIGLHSIEFQNNKSLKLLSDSDMTHLSDLKKTQILNYNNQVGLYKLVISNNMPQTNWKEGIDQLINVNKMVDIDDLYYDYMYLKNLPTQLTYSNNLASLNDYIRSPTTNWMEFGRKQISNAGTFLGNTITRVGNISNLILKYFTNECFNREKNLVAAMNKMKNNAIDKCEGDVFFFTEEYEDLIVEDLTVEKIRNIIWEPSSLLQKIKNTIRFSNPHIKATFAIVQLFKDWKKSIIDVLRLDENEKNREIMNLKSLKQATKIDILKENLYTFTQNTLANSKQRIGAQRKIYERIKKITIQINDYQKSGNVAKLKLLEGTTKFIEELEKGYNDGKLNINKIPIFYDTIQKLAAVLKNFNDLEIELVSEIKDEDTYKFKYSELKNKLNKQTELLLADLFEDPHIKEYLDNGLSIDMFNNIVTIIHLNQEITNNTDKISELNKVSENKDVKLIESYNILNKIYSIIIQNKENNFEYKCVNNSNVVYSAIFNTADATPDLKLPANLPDINKIIFSPDCKLLGKLKINATVDHPIPIRINNTHNEEGFSHQQNFIQHLITDKVDVYYDEFIDITFEDNSIVRRFHVYVSINNENNETIIKNGWISLALVKGDGKSLMADSSIEVIDILPNDILKNIFKKENQQTYTDVETFETYISSKQINFDNDLTKQINKMPITSEKYDNIMNLINNYHSKIKKYWTIFSDITNKIILTSNNIHEQELIKKMIGNKNLEKIIKQYKPKEQQETTIDINYDLFVKIMFQLEYENNMFMDIIRDYTYIEIVNVIETLNEILFNEKPINIKVLKNDSKDDIDKIRKENIETLDKRLYEKYEREKCNSTELIEKLTSSINRSPIKGGNNYNRIKGGTMLEDVMSQFSKYKSYFKNGQVNINQIKEKEKGDVNKTHDEMVVFVEKNKIIFLGYLNNYLNENNKMKEFIELLDIFDLSNDYFSEDIINNKYEAMVNDIKKEKEKIAKENQANTPVVNADQANTPVVNADQANTPVVNAAKENTRQDSDKSKYINRISTARSDLIQFIRNIEITISDEDLQNILNDKTTMLLKIKEIEKNIKSNTEKKENELRALKAKDYSEEFVGNLMSSAFKMAQSYNDKLFNDIIPPDATMVERIYYNYVISIQNYVKKHFMVSGENFELSKSYSDKTGFGSIIENTAKTLYRGIGNIWNIFLQLFFMILKTPWAATLVLSQLALYIKSVCQQVMILVGRVNFTSRVKSMGDIFKEFWSGFRAIFLNMSQYFDNNSFESFGEKLSTLGGTYSYIGGTLTGISRYGIMASDAATSLYTTTGTTASYVISGIGGWAFYLFANQINFLSTGISFLSTAAAKLIENIVKIFGSFYKEFMANRQQAELFSIYFSRIFKQIQAVWDCVWNGYSINLSSNLRYIDWLGYVRNYNTPLMILHPRFSSMTAEGIHTTDSNFKGDMAAIIATTGMTAALSAAIPITWPAIGAAVALGIGAEYLLRVKRDVSYYLTGFHSSYPRNMNSKAEDLEYDKFVLDSMDRFILDTVHKRILGGQFISQGQQSSSTDVNYVVNTTASRVKIYIEKSSKDGKNQVLTLKCIPAAMISYEPTPENHKITTETYKKYLNLGQIPTFFTSSEEFFVYDTKDIIKDKGYEVYMDRRNYILSHWDFLPELLFKSVFKDVIDAKFNVNDKYIYVSNEKLYALITGQARRRQSAGKEGASLNDIKIENFDIPKGKYDPKSLYEAIVSPRCFLTQSHNISPEDNKIGSLYEYVISVKSNILNSQNECNIDPEGISIKSLKTTNQNKSTAETYIQILKDYKSQISKMNNIDKDEKITDLKNIETFITYAEKLATGWAWVPHWTEVAVLKEIETLGERYPEISQPDMIKKSIRVMYHNTIIPICHEANKLRRRGIVNPRHPMNIFKNQAGIHCLCIGYNDEEKNKVYATYDNVVQNYIYKLKYKHEKIEKAKNEGWFRSLQISTSNLVSDIETTAAKAAALAAVDVEAYGEIDGDIIEVSHDLGFKTNYNFNGVSSTDKDTYMFPLIDDNILTDKDYESIESLQNVILPNVPYPCGMYFKNNDMKTYNERFYTLHQNEQNRISGLINCFQNVFNTEKEYNNIKNHLYKNLTSVMKKKIVNMIENEEKNDKLKKMSTMCMKKLEDTDNLYNLFNMILEDGIYSDHLLDKMTKGYKEAIVHGHKINTKLSNTYSKTGTPEQIAKNVGYPQLDTFGKYPARYNKEDCLPFYIKDSTADHTICYIPDALFKSWQEYFKIGPNIFFFDPEIISIIFDFPFYKTNGARFILNDDPFFVKWAKNIKLIDIINTLDDTEGMSEDTKRLVKEISTNYIRSVSLKELGGEERIYLVNKIVPYLDKKYELGYLSKKVIKDFYDMEYKEDDDAKNKEDKKRGREYFKGLLIDTLHEPLTTDLKAEINKRIFFATFMEVLLSMEKKPIYMYEFFWETYIKPLRALIGQSRSKNNSWFSYTVIYNVDIFIQKFNEKFTDSDEKDKTLYDNYYAKKTDPKYNEEKENIDAFFLKSKQGSRISFQSYIKNLYTHTNFIKIIKDKNYKEISDIFIDFFDGSIIRYLNDILDKKTLAAPKDYYYRDGRINIKHIVNQTNTILNVSEHNVRREAKEEATDIAFVISSPLLNRGLIDIFNPVIDLIQNIDIKITQYSVIESANAQNIDIKIKQSSVIESANAQNYGMPVVPGKNNQSWKNLNETTTEDNSILVGDHSDATTYYDVMTKNSDDDGILPIVSFSGGDSEDKPKKKYIYKKKFNENSTKRMFYINDSNKYTRKIYE